MFFSQRENNWCISKDLFKVLTGDIIEWKFFFKQDKQNKLIYEDWRFLYVLFVETVKSNTDPFITHIRIDCFLPWQLFSDMPPRNLTIFVVMV